MVTRVRGSVGCLFGVVLVCALGLGAAVWAMLGVALTPHDAVSADTAVVPADVLTHTADLGGDVLRLVPGGNGYAYVMWAQRVGVIDITDPTAPELVGELMVTSDEYLWDITAAGSTIYVTALTNLYVIDASDPTAPQIVTTHSTANVTFVAAANGYVYTCFWIGGFELQVLDLSDPLDPVVVGSVTEPSYDAWPTDLIVDGTMVYVLAKPSEQILWMVDAADAAHPDIRGTMAIYPSVFWHTPIVGVHDGYAHIAGGSKAEHAVQVVSLLDPTSPQTVGFYTPTVTTSPSSWFEQFAFSGERAYLTSDSVDLNVIDLSDPASPVVKSHIEIPGLSSEVIADGTDVYLGGKLGGLVAIDASALMALHVQGRAPFPGEGPMAATLGHAYISDHGLHVYDAGVPSHPSPVAFHDSWHELLAVGGQYGYAVTEPQPLEPDGITRTLAVVDLSNSLAPRAVSTVTLPGPIRRATVAGPLVFVESAVAYESLSGPDEILTGTVTVVDVSIPAAPRVRSTLTRSITVGDYANIVNTYARDSAVLGDLLVLCQPGITIVDFSTPDQLTIVNELQPEDTCYDLAIDDPYVYVRRYHRSPDTQYILVYDLSDPASPIEMARLDPVSTSMWSYLDRDPGVEVVGPYLFAANDSPRGIDIHNVSNLAMPVMLGTYQEVTMWPADLAVIGSALYVQGRSFGTQVFDITAGAGTMKVSGQALTAIGLPLPDVVVHAGTIATATTDAAGVYRFVELPATETTLWVEHPDVSMWDPPQRTVSDDAAWQSFRVWEAPEAGVTKDASPAPGTTVSANSSITYTLVVTAGAGDVVTDFIPQSTTYIAGSLVAPAWITYSAVSNAVTGTVPVTMREPVTITFAAEVGAATGVTIANTACVTPPGEACRASNTVQHPVQAQVWQVYLPLVTREPAAGHPE